MIAEGSGEVRHKLREQWRRQLHGEFTNQARRDSAKLRASQYDAGQTSLAIKIYQEASTEGRAVMTGAACSTAFYGKRKFGEPENTCSWCHRQVVADWHHLAWCCSGILMNNQRPPIPMASKSRHSGLRRTTGALRMQRLHRR